MSVLGIICEYNPFHNGHKYHLEESKKITGSKYVIAIMSGSFVQRGEPAFIDKFSRAQMAIDNGVDLVLELPFIFASQRAESFASGAIRLLNSLNIVKHICFGAESNNLEDLEKIAKLLAHPDQDFNNLLEKYLNLKLSFPLARSKAMAEYYKDASIEDTMNFSNNILAIEYLKAMELSNSSFKTHSIQREGADYNSLESELEFMSATGIRNSIKNKESQQVNNFLPKESIDILNSFYEKFGEFNDLEKYSDIIYFKLKFENLENIMDSTDDLINRLVNNSLIHKDINSLIEASISKTYTRSRIKRVLVHILFDLRTMAFEELDQNHPSYIRVLGANKNGLKLLKKIKASSQLPIINKFSNYHKLRDEKVDSIIKFDKISTDLFCHVLKNNPYNQDYLKSPYIKK